MIKSIRSNKCCIIGVLEENNSETNVVSRKYTVSLKNKLEGKIEKLIENFNVGTFLCEMSSSLSRLAATLVIMEKKDRPNIKLESYIPYESLADNWSEEERNLYFEIMKNSDVEKMLGYKKEKNSIKSTYEHIISNSDMVLVVWDGDQGDTANAVNIAISKEKPVLIINLNDI